MRTTQEISLSHRALFCALGPLLALAACETAPPPPPPDTQPKLSGPIRFVPKSQLRQANAPAYPDGPESSGPLPTASSPEALAQGPGAWSIVLASFPRDSGQAQANAALQRCRARPGLEQAYLEDRGKAIVVAFGSYRAGSDDQARHDLERIRATELDGVLAFENAVLAPPPFDGLTGTIPEYDLTSAKQRFGRSALYTLQVAAYQAPAGKTPSPDDLKEVRLAAERAAVELRREGDQAFYYHGPTGSMVTVGLFADKEYDVQHPERESPRITLLRRKYPYNLVNGATYLVKSRGQTKATEQPSFLVSVPN